MKPDTSPIKSVCVCVWHVPMACQGHWVLPAAGVTLEAANTAAGLDK